MIWCFSFSFEEENLHSFPSFFLLFPVGYERVMNGVFIGLILPNYTLAPILSFSLQFESRSLCLYIFLFNFLIITFIYHVYNNIVIYSLLYFFSEDFTNTVRNYFFFLIIFCDFIILHCLKNCFVVTFIFFSISLSPSHYLNHEFCKLFCFVFNFC